MLATWFLSFSVQTYLRYYTSTSCASLLFSLYEWERYIILCDLFHDYSAAMFLKFGTLLKCQSLEWYTNSIHQYTCALPTIRALCFHVNYCISTYYSISNELSTTGNSFFRRPFRHCTLLHWLRSSIPVQ